MKKQSIQLKNWINDYFFDLKWKKYKISKKFLKRLISHWEISEKKKYWAYLQTILFKFRVSRRKHLLFVIVLWRWFDIIYSQYIKDHLNARLMGIEISKYILANCPQSKEVFNCNFCLFIAVVATLQKEDMLKFCKNNFMCWEMYLTNF